MKIEVEFALEEHYAPDPIISHSAMTDPFEDNPAYTPFHISTEKSAKTYVSKALKTFGPGKPIVVTGAGAECTKAVTCAEIIKSNYFKKTVYQITRITQMSTTEIWEPLTPGLDALSVTRSVPIIHILLSLERLDENDPGYQKSNRESKRIVENPSEDELSSTPSSPVHSILNNTI